MAHLPSNPPAHQAGVQAGGLPALRILTHLLFGEGPPPQHPRFSAIPPPEGYGLELRVSGTAGLPCCQSAFWL